MDQLDTVMIDTAAPEKPKKEDKVIEMEEFAKESPPTNIGVE